MRIFLRAIKEKDSAKLFEWINDSELIGLTYYFHPVSEAEHKEWFKNLHNKKVQASGKNQEKGLY